MQYTPKKEINICYLLKYNFNSFTFKEKVLIDAHSIDFININAIICKIENISKRAYEVIFRKKFNKSLKIRVGLNKIFFIFFDISSHLILLSLY